MIEISYSSVFEYLEQDSAINHYYSHPASGEDYRKSARPPLLSKPDERRLRRVVEDAFYAAIGVMEAWLSDADDDGQTLKLSLLPWINVPEPLLKILLLKYIRQLSLERISHSDTSRSQELGDDIRLMLFSSEPPIEP